MKTPTQYFSVTQNSSISPCFFGACNPSHGQDLCCCFLQDLQALVPLTSAAWRLEKLSQTPNVTLPETNSSHLKMDGWNTSFLLGWPVFRCYVSFREGNPFHPRQRGLGFFFPTSLANKKNWQIWNPSSNRALL